MQDRNLLLFISTETLLTKIQQEFSIKLLLELTWQMSAWCNVWVITKDLAVSVKVELEDTEDTKDSRISRTEKVFWLRNLNQSL